MDLKVTLKTQSLETLLDLQQFLTKEIAARRSEQPSSHLVTFTDGAARGNPGPGGAGVLLFDSNGQKVLEDFRYLGACTNNEAEYRALLLALDHAASRTKGRVECFMDSELLVRQLNGEYAIKSEKLTVFFNQVKEKINGFSQVTFTHVPREHPRLQLADRLANKAIDEAKLRGEIHGR